MIFISGLDSDIVEGEGGKAGPSNAPPLLDRTQGIIDSYLIEFIASHFL